MKRVNDSRANQIAYWVLMLAGCAVFLLMNLFTPLKEDDYFHAFIFSSDGIPIASLGDVFKSWYKHSLIGGGRFANLFDFTFNGLLGKSVFNVVNTLVFAVMCDTLVRLCAKRRRSAMALAILFAFICFAWPVPGETMLWLAGSCNYLWSVTAALLLVDYLLHHSNPRPGVAQGCGVVVLAMLAGGCNESTSMGVAGGMMCYYLFNRTKIDRAVLLAMCGYLGGIAVLLCSPGSWSRAAADIPQQMAPAQLLLSRLHIMASHGLRYVTPVTALVAAAFAWCKWGTRKAFNSTPWGYIFICLTAILFVLGKNQERPFTAWAVVGFVITTIWVLWLTRGMAWLRWGITTVALVLSAWHISRDLPTIKHYQAYFEQMEQEVARGQEQCILPEREFNGYSRFVKPFYLKSWGYFIREKAMCWHFGKTNIQFVNDTILDRFNSGRLLDGASQLPFTSSMPDVISSLQAVGGDYVIATTPQGSGIRHTNQRVIYRAGKQATDAADAAQQGKAQTVSFFPIIYQGCTYYVLPPIDESVTEIALIDLAADKVPVQLVRQATQ